MPSRRQMAVYLFSGWISFEQFALVLAWTGLDALRMSETQIRNTQMHTDADVLVRRPPSPTVNQRLSNSSAAKDARNARTVIYIWMEANKWTQ